MKAIAYIRFSTDEQADGNSIARQTENIENYCQQKGFEIIETVVDAGFSAFEGDHLDKGNLGPLMKRADAGKYRGCAFVVEEMDRLSRMGIFKTSKLLNRMLDDELQVHITQTNRVISSSEDADDLVTHIMNGLESHGAQAYSKKLRERVGKAWAAKKANAAVNHLAISPRVPAWLHAEFDSETGKGKPVITIPDRAQTVRRIFQLAAEGLGGKRIVTALIAEGRQPFVSERGGQGCSWTPEYVVKMLHNRSVLGEYRPHRLMKIANKKKRVPVGDPIPNFYPEVVDQSLFNAAQEKVAEKTRNKQDRGGDRGGRRNLVNSILSPLVYDGDRLMVFWQKKGDPAYLMSKWVAGQKQHFIRYDRLEKAFLSFLVDADWKAIAGHGESVEVIAATARLEAVLGEIDRTSQKIAQLQKFVDEGSLSVSLFDALDVEKAKLVDATARKEKLSTEVNSARAKVQALHAPEDLLAAVRSGDPELRMKLKVEIAKRVKKISIEFDGKTPTQATVELINGWRDFILFPK